MRGIVYAGVGSNTISRTRGKKKKKQRYPSITYSDRWPSRFDVTDHEGIIARWRAPRARTPNARVHVRPPRGALLFPFFLLPPPSFSLFSPPRRSSGAMEEPSEAKKRAHPPKFRHLFLPFRGPRRSPWLGAVRGTEQRDGRERGLGQRRGVSLRRLFSSHSSASRPPLVAPRSRYHRPPKKVDWPWK